MSKNCTSHTEKKQKLRYQYLVWAVLLVLIAFVAVVRVRLLDVPFERDEGEYAYAGQLILQGIPPYSQVYNMKLPGVYTSYALIMAVFGQTRTAIHLGLLIINVATILLVFLLGKRLFNSAIGLIAAASFAVLSLGDTIQGLFANAEHFVILPALGGILLLVRAIDRNKKMPLFASALLLGVAFTMKQHAIAFILFAALYLLISEFRRRPLAVGSIFTKCILFALGVTIPFALTCLILYKAGVFDKFWFWTFEYAREYVSSVPLSKGLEHLCTRGTLIFKSVTLLWPLASVGLVGLFCNANYRKNRLFVSAFLIFSFLAVCPGLYFRPHYFLFLLPAVALLAGVGIDFIRDLIAKSKLSPIANTVSVIIALSVLSHGIYQQRSHLFSCSPDQLSRKVYGSNPFPESVRIAEYIRKNSNEDDTIAVIGSEPQIYFYANRRSATSYIYTYDLMGDHRYALQMQEEMIAQIEKAKPKFMVFVNISYSWLPFKGSSQYILAWFNRYRRMHYKAVGVIDILSFEYTRYLWGEQVIGYKPKENRHLYVFRRKDVD